MWKISTLRKTTLLPKRSNLSAIKRHQPNKINTTTTDKKLKYHDFLKIYKWKNVL